MIPRMQETPRKAQSFALGLESLQLLTRYDRISDRPSCFVTHFQIAIERYQIRHGTLLSQAVSVMDSLLGLHHVSQAICSSRSS